MLQVCQLTQLKQTKEWEKYPDRVWYISETLLSENLGRHCLERPASRTNSEIKLLIQENGKLQDLFAYTDGSVTKDQLGRGFTAKQCETTIHGDSAACVRSQPLQ